MEINGWRVSDTDERSKALLSDTGDIDIQGFKDIVSSFFIPENGMVFDCGASIGDTAVAYARMGFWVVAFEPFKDSFECLEHNVKNFPKVTCKNIALGNGQWVEFNYDYHYADHGCRSFNEGHGENAIQTVKIDDLETDRLDHLKIDVEGFEYEVLLGAKSTIERFKPTIFVELMPYQLGKQNKTYEDVVGIIRKMGYKIFTKPSLEKEFTTLDECWTNVFCVHSSSNILNVRSGL